MSALYSGETYVSQFDVTSSDKLSSIATATDREMAMAVQCLEFIQTNDVNVAIQYLSTNIFSFNQNFSTLVDLEQSVNNRDIEGCCTFFEDILTGHIVVNAAHAQIPRYGILFNSQAKLDVLLRFAEYREKKGELTYNAEDAVVWSNKRQNMNLQSTKNIINNYINGILIEARKHRNAIQKLDAKKNKTDGD